jgi:hypothetical protein
MAMGGGVTPRQHRDGFIAAKPACVFELLAVHDDVARKRFGMAADHQGGRKRPGLGGKIIHPPADDANLLADFAADRILERLAGLHKPGETGPHGVGKSARAAEHAIAAIDRQHDDDGIGAGKMRGRAGRAIAPPAALGWLSGGAAVGAKPVARVPMQQRLGLGERGQMIGGDQSLHGNGAQIDDHEIMARFERARDRGIEPVAKARRALEQTEKYDLGAFAERARLGKRKRRVVDAGGFLEHDQFAADDIGGGLRMILRVREPGGVGAALRHPFDPALGIAERRFRTEIRMRSHAAERNLIPPLRAAGAGISGRKVPAAAIAAQAGLA